MPIRILTIPFDKKHGLFLEDDLNRFCDARAVIHRREEFFTSGDKAYWTIWIEYEDEEKVERGQAEFIGEDLSLLKSLRVWRADKADKLGLPAYVVLTNRELEAVVKRKPGTLEQLRQIRGFGRKKLERFGKELLGLLGHQGLEADCADRASGQGVQKPVHPDERQAGNE